MRCLVALLSMVAWGTTTIVVAQNTSNQDPSMKRPYQRTMEGAQLEQSEELDQQFDRSLEMNDTKSARGILLRKIALHEQYQGEDHWNVTNLKVDLHRLDVYSKLSLADLNRLQDAKDLMTQSVTLTSQSDFRNAIRLCEEAFLIRRDILGENSTEATSCLNNLGELHRNLGDFQKAKSFLNQSRTLKLQLLGAMHPDYATVLNNQACLYSSIGEYQLAEPLFVESRNVLRDTLGPEHPRYITSVNNLAAIYIEMGRFALAESLLLQNLEFHQSEGNQAFYARCLNNLGTLYQEMGDYSKARAFLLSAIA